MEPQFESHFRNASISLLDLGNTYVGGRISDNDEVANGLGYPGWFRLLLLQQKVVHLDVLRTFLGVEMIGTSLKNCKAENTELYVRVAALMRMEPFLIIIAVGSVMWRTVSSASLSLMLLFGQECRLTAEIKIRGKSTADGVPGGQISERG